MECIVVVRIVVLCVWGGGWELFPISSSSLSSICAGAHLSVVEWGGRKLRKNAADTGRVVFLALIRKPAKHDAMKSVFRQRLQ